MPEGEATTSHHLFGRPALLSNARFASAGNRFFNPLIRQMLSQAYPIPVFLVSREKMERVIKYGDAGYQPQRTFATPQKKNAVQS